MFAGTDKIHPPMRMNPVKNPSAGSGNNRSNRQPTNRRLKRKAIRPANKNPFIMRLKMLSITQNSIILPD
jgi:hypothetical protein